MYLKVRLAHVAGLCVVVQDQIKSAAAGEHEVARQLEGGQQHREEGRTTCVCVCVCSTKSAEVAGQVEGGQQERQEGSTTCGRGYGWAALSHHVLAQLVNE